MNLWIFEVFGSLDLLIVAIEGVGLRIVCQRWGVVLIGRERRMKLMQRGISALVRSARKRRRYHVHFIFLYIYIIFFEAHSRNRRV